MTDATKQQYLEGKVSNILGTSKKVQNVSMALTGVYALLFPVFSLTAIVAMNYYRCGKQLPQQLEAVFYSSLGLMGASMVVSSLGYGLWKKLENRRFNKLKREFPQMSEDIDSYYKKILWGLK